MMRVFRYGLLPPTENVDVVFDQMRMAHRYRNTLVEIERGRRAALRQLDAESIQVGPFEIAVKEAEAERDAADVDIKRARSADRKRSAPVTKEMRERLISARVKLRDAYRALKDAKAEERLRVRDVVKPAQEAVGQRVNDLAKNARAHSGLARLGPYSGAFGTYQLVEMAMDQSRKTTKFWEDPGFVSIRDVWRLRVGVQIGDGGLPIEAVFGDDGRVQIGKVSEAAWHDRSGGEARAPGQGRAPKMRTTLRLRLGVRVDTGEVLYATWPMVMHREIPKGAVVKRVDVTRERVGRRFQWYVCVTTDLSACERRNVSGDGRIAVGFGWPTMPDGDLRVAVHVDDRGTVGAAHLERWKHDAEGNVIHDRDGNPIPGWIEYDKKVDSLHAIRDDAFNAAREQLGTWLSVNETIIPEWLRTATATLPQWKSINRLYNLAHRWRGERFNGDVAAFDAIEKWRYHEHHLEEWESSQRARSKRMRREQYRIFAKRMSERYRELVIGDFDRREISRRPGTLDRAQNDTASANRARAATADLEGALKSAFGAAGGVVTIVKIENATHECAACGHLNVFDAAVVREVTCANVECGATWDIDVNLCRNLLKRSERSGDAPDPGDARTGGNTSQSAGAYESKWQKAKRLKREKEDEKGAARKADGEAAE